MADPALIQAPVDIGVVRISRIVQDKPDARSTAGILKIREQLYLEHPLYKQTAVFGHFGRKEFPWERTDRVKALKDTIL